MAHAIYDLLVIGSGPAGQKAALSAAKIGKRVAIIDRGDMLGGVCIHTGTIPSKAMREAVLHYIARGNITTTRGETIHDLEGDHEGGHAIVHDVSMAELLERCRRVIRSEASVVRNQMMRNNVSMLFGTASFIDAHTLRITRPANPGTYTDSGSANGDEIIDVSGRNILIAVGTEPARPASVPFTPGRVIDSDGLLTLTDLPRSLIIVGGGVIGSEYAAMLAAVGVRVTLVESRPRLLEFIDDELAENLQFRMRDRGIRLRLGESVAHIDLHGEHVEATLASGKILRSQSLLYAIGRQGATAGLNLPAAGLTADNRGRLAVNEFFQTTTPHIYAAGDVIGFPALAATSMEQGRLASCHMFHELAEPPSMLYPLGIYTIPEISMVGQTEQALTAAKIPYEVGIARYREIARGQLINDPHGLLKLLFHPDSRRLLGVHAIGTGATELIHIGQAVMAAGMPIDYFVDSIFNYPTLAECYKVAALDGVNRIRVSTAPVTSLPLAA
ncbi:MAG: Si-specific NAD(P)(+) transhydrogenase [Phycisphaerae bacterium]|nr:Si-specific NAD(P)(+) transhydrogenase [Phycisphaerae bacterium]